MKFSLQDAEGREVERDRYMLSLKDMNQSDHLLDLIEAGASSFKIEGRLKDISYVKNVTAAYSQRLNEIIRRFPDQYCRSSRGVCHYTFTPDLRKTFNRGYTTYFLKGRQPDIASFDTPKAMGEYVGVVKELRADSFNVAGVASFSNGDGLCYMDENRQLEGFRANRVVGNRIYPYRMPKGLHPGVRLYRNSDQEFDRLLSRPSAERKIPIRMALRAISDGFELRVEETVLRVPFEHQQAQKSPRENIIRQLTKLGDTIYFCEAVDIPDDFNYFIPNSVLSDMRRGIIELIKTSSSEVRGVRSENTHATEHPLHSNLPPQTSLYSSHHYLLNISNRLSQTFYGVEEQTAYELRGGNGPIMQCRHCIRYALGYCIKHGGQRPTWREPLSLVLGDGRRFRLEFDCKNCQMNVYAS
jgi:putative protease